MARIFLLLVVCIVSACLSRCSSAAASSACVRQEFSFLDDLREQCPAGVEVSPALEVNGETLDKTLDRELTRGQQCVYNSVLFYASWCPFSSRTRPIFDALSSMFPQITHLAVEESSAMPSVFSRFGIHSFPAILLVNGTTRVRYHGLKDLKSLVHFYKETTGLKPVSHFIAEQPSNSKNDRASTLWGGSIEDLVTNEPYVALGLLFICSQIIIRFFRVVFPRLRAFWNSHVWQLNVGIFRESSNLLKQTLPPVDVERLWRKVRLFNKARNFHRGAKNARVWASSLASVSLGESSSPRIDHPGS